MPQYDPADGALHPRPRRRRCSSSTRSAPAAPRSSPPAWPAPYLEELGVAVPPDAAQARRARRHRVPVPAVGGIDGLLARRRAPGRAPSRSSRPAARRPTDEIEVVVPLRGLQMPTTRLELATATIVRADTVEVPPRRGSRRAPASPAGSPPSWPRARRRAEPRPTATTRPAGCRRPRRERVPAADHRHFACSRPGASGWARMPGPEPARPLAADRHRRRPAAARRLPPRRGGARRPRRALAHPRLSLVALRRAGQRRPGTPRARRGRSPASRRAWSAASSSRRSTTTSWRCGSCSREAAPRELGLSMRVSALCAEPSIATRSRRSSTAAWRSSASCGAAASPWRAMTAPPRRGHGGDRGLAPRDPQGRRLRPSGLRPAVHRRRDPARRRAGRR